MCQWKTVASNCVITSVRIWKCTWEQRRRRKKNTSHKNILTSSFQQFRFLFFSFIFNSLQLHFLELAFFSSPHFLLKSNFLYQFFAVILSLFYIVGLSLRIFTNSDKEAQSEREGERIVFSDYLLNDIMTSNLVINQILIVLFVAVNIQTDTFFDAMNSLFSDAYGEAKTGKTWTTTMMALPFLLRLLLLLLLIRRTDKVIISIATTTMTTKKDVRKFHIK